jgi:hypothetical protein
MAEDADHLDGSILARFRSLSLNHGIGNLRIRINKVNAHGYYWWMRILLWPSLINGIDVFKYYGPRWLDPSWRRMAIGCDLVGWVMAGHRQHPDGADLGRGWEPLAPLSPAMTAQ